MARLVRCPRLYFALVIGALASACGVTAPEGALPDPRTRLDSVLDFFARQTGSPAIAGALIWPDSIQTSTLGARKLGDPASVSASDRFHLGSNTKAMTATMIAVLVERGQLAWTTTVASVFPELGDSIHTSLRAITLEQLLSHRAGIRPYMSGQDFVALPAFSGNGTAQRRAFTAFLLNTGAASPVGQFAYSNAGYSIAAAMAERVAGKSWEMLLDELLFAPLGVDGGFGWPAASEADQPWGHWMVNNRLEPHDPNGAYKIPTVIDPGGSVNMTIADYARFVQLHLRGMLGSASIITSASYQKLHTPIGDYALGWVTQPIDGVATHAHDGSGGTFYATVLIQKDREFAVAVVVNAASPQVVASMLPAALALLKLR